MSGNDPVFPVIESIEAEPFSGSHSVNSTSGISLRDWLSGLAMQGLCANPDVTDTIAKTKQNIPKVIAEMAIESADSLIKELERKRT